MMPIECDGFSLGYDADGHDVDYEEFQSLED